MNLKKYVAGMEKAAAENVGVEAGDYVGEDGLLVCGKCHTPKQCRIYILDMERTPMCLCKCAQEEREKEEAERKKLKFNKRVLENRRRAFPEADMQNWVFANDDKSNERVSNIAENYADNFELMIEKSKGLLMFGPVGTGKTFYAACIANALLDKGYPVMMLNFDRVRNTLMGMREGKQAYLDSFNLYPLLILDDLGAESKSEYMQEVVFSVVDARYRAGLPTIVTTNLTSEALKNPKDLASQRIYSRLLEMCLAVHVDGKDKRREKCKDGYLELSEILGL